MILFYLFIYFLKLNTFVIYYGVTFYLSSYAFVIVVLVPILTVTWRCKMVVVWFKIVMLMLNNEKNSRNWTNDSSISEQMSVRHMGHILLGKSENS